MIRFDALRDILETIRHNKLRTVLTAFAVAWGIFMLIVLLGASSGLRNGIMSAFSQQAENYVELWPGRTSKPFQGLPLGRRFKFSEQDIAMLKKRIPAIEYITGSMWRQETFSRGEEYLDVTLQGATTEFVFLNHVRVSRGDGRFLNALDEQLNRKVCVIHPMQKEFFFGDENPIGQFLYTRNTAYQVIGVYSASSNFESNNPPVYIPLSTARILYARGEGFENIRFSVAGLATKEENEAFGQTLRQIMGRFHAFDPTDRSALYVWNSAQTSLEIQRVFSILNIFLVIVGLSSMVAGIVGVGNIMYITVRERTREMGIRKAIGASPASIVKLVILESVFITTAAGYLGILLGVGFTELCDAALSGKEFDGVIFFEDPSVDMGVIAGATVLLIGCGVVAGLIPSLKAVRVKPVEAMKAD